VAGSFTEYPSGLWPGDNEQGERQNLGKYEVSDEQYESLIRDIERAMEGKPLGDAFKDGYFWIGGGGFGTPKIPLPPIFVQMGSELVRYAHAGNTINNPMGATRGAFNYNYILGINDAMVSEAEIFTDKTTLDVGSGSGRAIIELSRRYLGTYIGADLGYDREVEAVELGEPGVQLVKYDWNKKMHFLPDESVDNIISCMTVFRHGDDMSASNFIAEATRVVRPGGLVLIGSEGYPSVSAKLVFDEFTKNGWQIVYPYGRTIMKNHCSVDPIWAVKASETEVLGKYAERLSTDPVKAIDWDDI